MIQVGQTVGNYRILAKIGTGGMGAVFLAEHPLIGKRAAIKVIHRELANNRDVVSRFFQEARAVNQIGNEHIVEIHDFGVSPEGDHFYIMEYLEGQTLASVLGREKVMHVMRALHVGAQIASALGAAHACGVIHRDLKPDNVMLTTRLGDPDFVKVLDFGLAKVFQDAPIVQTAAGVLLGTPQYMSPEACESRGGVDHRTDVYALGILLFQMMTGQLPFHGSTMGEVLVKQVTILPPAPRGLNPSIPPSVEQIVLRCLAKSADARFQTMAALREALLHPDGYLQSAPPMQPARSVAPGEMGFAARDVVAYAAQQQQQRRTNGMAAMAGPSLSPQQQTILAAPAPNVTGGMGAVPPPRLSGTQPVPALQPPALPKMNTMRIATPVGYTSHPPRRVWPIVVVLGLLLGIGGGGLAVAYFGGGAKAAAAIDAAPGATPATVDASARPIARDAGMASTPAIALDAAAARPAPTKATVTFESLPKGATVLVDGARTCTTPCDAEIELGEVVIQLQLAGYKMQTLTKKITSSTTINIELQPTSGMRTSPRPATGSAPKRPDDKANGLARPGDD